MRPENWEREDETGAFAFSSFALFYDVGAMVMTAFCLLGAFHDSFV